MTELGRHKEKANRTGTPFSPLSDAFHMTERASEQERDEEIERERELLQHKLCSHEPFQSTLQKIFTQTYLQTNRKADK